MYLLIYISLNLAVVLITLFICNAADAERKNHVRKLIRHGKNFRTILAECCRTGDFRFTDKALKPLKHTIGLEAFFEAVNELDINSRRRVMLDNSDRIIKILSDEKHPTVHAYFSYMLKDIKIEGANGGGYGTLMIRFLDDNSVFSRENALKSIYSFGDARLVELALTLLSEKGVIHNEKLVVDGLMSFPGDKELLATNLMKHYDTLLECYRNSLINFLNFAHIDKFDDMLIRRASMQETSIDTICCITRKINKEQSDRNLKYLIDITRRFKEGSDWEPVSVAVMGLGSYKDNEEVKSILKKELLSRNWYIRKHSAESLALLGLTDADLDEIHANNDRFANDAINYAMRYEHA